MKKYWQRFKAWTKHTAQRFKLWVLGILASLGLVTVAVVAPGDIFYTPATEYEDGTPLPLSQIAETRLYCNGALVASEAGADGVFDDAKSLLPVGDNVCYGTHVATNAMESRPGESITVTVLPTAAPLPPELLP